ncbi:hypothetical protein CW751_14490 [Brumimicrobium salinarum]|uniref:Uncharacterized protein n=1 Tax=Brumimicrobium salinarum TaxID=2058658 RepID=A0A2I0QYZ4_9FLAO|nr:hypothetical protein [Brumimicrobium salinarum]PKR79555.1 hypothetical protein CW751_14490 [Brumimicrobium salinarum]
MLALFIEKEALDNILFFEDEKYPFINSVLKRKIPIIVNTTDDLLQNDFDDEESPIYLAMQESEGFSKPIAYEAEFERIDKNPQLILNHPRNIYILDINTERAEKLTNELGVIVLSVHNLDDNLLKGGLSMSLMKGKRIENGWDAFYDQKWVKGNSLVISDSYLFQNNEGKFNRGVENILKLLDSYLPKSLKTDFHITIIADNDPPSKGNGKAVKWWERSFGALKAKISEMRDYNIQIEIFLGPTLHKRIFISNYIYSWVDKGFDVFKCSDANVVQDDNEIHIHHIFNNIEDFGESYFSMSETNLTDILKKCNAIADLVASEGKQSFSRMALGIKDPSKKSKNRLLN